MFELVMQVLFWLIIVGVVLIFGSLMYHTIRGKKREKKILWEISDRISCEKKKSCRQKPAARY